MDTIAGNAITEAVDIYKPFISDIKGLVKASSDSNTVGFVLDSFISKTFLKRLSNHIQDSLESGDALGRSLIVEKNRLLSEKAKIAHGVFFVGEKLTAAAIQWFALGNEVVKISFDLIPKEAIDYLRKKALTIAGIEHQQLIDFVKQKLAETLEAGKSFNYFKAEIDQLFDSYGVTKLSQHHIETVFQVNVFSSYTAGQLSQVQSMSDRFPLYNYSAIHDERSRHLALEGIYRVGNGPLPPVDFGCRCTIIFLHISQITGQEKIRETWNRDLVKFEPSDTYEVWVAENQDKMGPALKNWFEKSV